MYPIRPILPVHEQCSASCPSTPGTVHPLVPGSLAELHDRLSRIPLSDQGQPQMVGLRNTCLCSQICCTVTI